METSIDANLIFTTEELNLFRELAKVNEDIKRLEAEKQNLVDRAKQVMKDYNAKTVRLNNHLYSAVTSQRRTVTKSTKDEFIINLINNNKRHLLTTSIEPDLDSIFAEVDAGTLDRDFVERYVKVTETTSLRCT